MRTNCRFGDFPNSLKKIKREAIAMNTYYYIIFGTIVTSIKVQNNNNNYY